MPAPPNNTNAAKVGVSPLIRVRLASAAHVEIITALLDPIERGKNLWQAAIQAADLIILDADGTIIERDTEEYLPLLAEIYNAHPRRVAIVTNQGGPACHDAGWPHSNKFPSLAKVEKKYAKLAGYLNARLYLSLAYQRSNGEWIYPTGVAKDDPRLCHDWRKPSPGMLIQAMRDCGAKPSRTIMIGDSDDDDAAAAAAGVFFLRV